MKSKVIAVLILVMLMSANVMPVGIYAGESVIITIDSTMSEQEIDSVNDDVQLSITPFGDGYVLGNVIFDAESTVLKIYLDATSIGIASKIGYKNIYIRTWIAGSSAYSSQKIADLYSTNTSTFGGTITVTNPVAGNKYQLIVTCFAIINGVEHSIDMESGKLTFE